MYRKIEDYLKQWRLNVNRKPMILRGARQVGKTYIIDKFGIENYTHYLKINLEQDSNLQAIFATNKPQQIVNELSALYNVPILDHQTLIFIDEIQISPTAISALRYFYEQMPNIHIITAGSLLDHSLNEIQYAMPVGRVEFAYMYPLSFIEFLTAFEETGLVDYIESYTIENAFSQAIHNKLCDYLRLYFFIGGMPEAVRTYIDTKNLIEVEKVHSSILTSLQYDFAKYGTRKQQEFLTDVLNYCANNIGRKVKYVTINKNAHSSQLKEALLKLELSRVLHLVRNTKSAETPITQYLDSDIFKPIFLDIGLVNSLAKIKLSDIQNLVTDFEGALAEQFVGQEFIANRNFYSEQKLYYWHRESKNSNAEIDYLYQIDNKIFPVEVKSGKRGTLKSLHVFLSEKGKSTGIRFNLDLPNFGIDLTASLNIKNAIELKYNLLSLPLYFAGNLNRIFQNSDIAL